MLFRRVLRTSIALLSQFYLVIVMTFAATAMMPMAFHWEPTIVMSGSMEPRVMAGDVIVAMPVPQRKIKEDIQIGQVLLAKNVEKPGTLITHRVIQVLPNGNGYITKGDANLSNDDTVLLSESIKGIERIRVPYIGIPFQALKTGDPIPATIFVLITVFAGISVFGEKARIREQEDNERCVADPSITRAELRKRHTKWILIKTSAGLVVVAILVSCFFLTADSNALFIDTKATAVSIWTTCHHVDSSGKPCKDKS
jgi:signal peptidase I